VPVLVGLKKKKILPTDRNFEVKTMQSETHIFFLGLRYCYYIMFFLADCFIVGFFSVILVSMIMNQLRMIMRKYLRLYLVIKLP
jgi:hypothetical protein